MARTRPRQANIRGNSPGRIPYTKLSPSFLDDVPGHDVESILFNTLDEMANRAALVTYSLYESPFLERAFIKVAATGVIWFLAPLEVVKEV